MPTLGLLPEPVFGYQYMDGISGPGKFPDRPSKKSLDVCMYSSVTIDGITRNRPPVPGSLPTFHLSCFKQVRCSLSKARINGRQLNPHTRVFTRTGLTTSSSTATRGRETVHQQNVAFVSIHVMLAPGINQPLLFLTHATIRHKCVEPASSSITSP